MFSYKSSVYAITKDTLKVKDRRTFSLINVSTKKKLLSAMQKIGYDENGFIDVIDTLSARKILDLRDFTYLKNISSLNVITGSYATITSNDGSSSIYDFYKRTIVMPNAQLRVEGGIYWVHDYAGNSITAYAKYPEQKLSIDGIDSVTTKKETITVRHFLIVRSNGLFGVLKHSETIRQLLDKTPDSTFQILPLYQEIHVNESKYIGKKDADILICKKDGHYGALDLSGKVIIDFVFDEIKLRGAVMPGVFKTKANIKNGLIVTGSNVNIPCRLVSTLYCIRREMLFTIMKENKYYLQIFMILM